MQLSRCFFVKKSAMASWRENPDVMGDITMFLH